MASTARVGERDRLIDRSGEVSPAGHRQAMARDVVPEVLHGERSARSTIEKRRHRGARTGGRHHMAIGTEKPKPIVHRVGYCGCDVLVQVIRFGQLAVTRRAQRIGISRGVHGGDVGVVGVRAVAVRAGQKP